jgi:hypothetical protein
LQWWFKMHTCFKKHCLYSKPSTQWNFTIDIKEALEVFKTIAIQVFHKDDLALKELLHMQ